MSQQSPERPPSPALLNSQNVPLAKPERLDVKVELQQIRRIVNGANKRLDRLCNSLGSFNEQLSQK